MDQPRGPAFVSGRVVMDTGRPVPEPVTVELNCGMRPLQVIHTDLGGYFTFNLGTGMQSNFDFSAANESPTSFGGGSRATASQGFAGSLRGCELRVSVAGYHPINQIITQHMDTGRVEVGTLRLQRIAETSGSAISVSSLLVPDDARKEYERAIKDLQNKNQKSARDHLAKAIAKHDEYAAAWYQLGRIDLSAGDRPKAAQAFERAIGIDPQYSPPYMDLAMLHVQDQQWQAAVETTTKVLAMDSSLGYASFLQAVGNFNLNQFDAAEESARVAEKMPHENIPQVHALLADIVLRQERYVEAVAEMRKYLEEAPQGQFAEQMKKNLAQLEPHLPLSEAAPGDPAVRPEP
jgi:tetratricopeptide (TPR) repeat protein